MDWYYKAALVLGLIWATARALGVYGEAARELDIAFLFGFLLTTGGWAAVFLIIDRVAKFLGWKRGTPTSQAATADRAADTPVATPPMPVERPVTPIHRRASRRPRR